MSKVLGKTLGNVKVYYCDNESKECGTNNYWHGIFTGIKYQCVELARRFWIINYGITFEPVRFAYMIFYLDRFYRVSDNKKVNISHNFNGSEEGPKIGSLLIWKPLGDFVITGHIAVIIKIGDNYVEIVEQNNKLSYKRRIKMDINNINNIKSYLLKDKNILGWLNIV